MKIESAKAQNQQKKWKIIKSNIGFVLLLGLLLFLVYSRVAFFDFVAFDDNHYVYENEKVIQGITWDNVKWAFSFSDQTYWHPLTWISLMLDSEMFGICPGAFHLVNLIWHFFSSILVYLLFCILMDKRMPAALIAILFAIHPVNVESVAWITERKNVLSTFFILSSLLSYCYYDKSATTLRFSSTFFLFFFGLLTKPIAVITPCLFILVDIWFLRNEFLKKKQWLVVLGEKILRKISFFVVGFFVVFIASKSLEQQSMLVDFIKVPILLRISNAITSLISYLLIVIFPVGLGVYYPFPDNIHLLKTFASFFVLVSITFIFLKQATIRPYFLFGWLWFIVSLIPVLGIKIAGLWPAYADRWAYIPAIGIFFIFSSLFFEFYERLENLKRFFSVFLLCIICLLSVATFIQLNYWENSEKLFSRTISVTDNNWVMHYNLGKVLEINGDLENAIANYEIALKINPRDIDSIDSLGALLYNQGETTKALLYFDRAIQLAPKHYSINRNRGLALLSEEKYLEGLEALERALNLHPDLYQDPIFLYEFAHANHKLGHHRKAIFLLEKSIQLDSDYEPSRTYLLHIRGSIQSIIQQILTDIQKQPNDPELFLLLGNQYFFLGEKNMAMKHYRKAVKIQPRFSKGLYNLSLLSKERGDYFDAIHFYRKYLEVVTPSGENLYYLSCLYGLTRQNDRALEYLRKAFFLVPSLIEKAGKDPCFKLLSSSTEFQEMLKSLTHSEFPVMSQSR